MANVPGLVKAMPPGSNKLSGHFEIREIRPGENFIFSASSKGGACLVAQYPVVPKSCNQHSQCGLPPSGIGNGAYAYCVAEQPGALAPAGAGTCWIKPSEDFCLKGVGPGAFDTAPADTTQIVRAAGVKQWRLLTCLNGVPGACSGQVDATPNELQHEAGDIYTAP